MNTYNVKREPVSKVGAVLFIFTILFMIALIVGAVMLAFSLDDIAAYVIGMFTDTCPVCGSVLPK